LGCYGWHQKAARLARASRPWKPLVCSVANLAAASSTRVVRAGLIGALARGELPGAWSPRQRATPQPPACDATNRTAVMTSSNATLFRQLTRAVFAAHSSVLRYGDRANAAFGQSSARWRVMFNIAQGNGSVSEIARETDYTRQSVQRLADTLVTDGLATYARDSEDRRRQIITLTVRGSELLAEMEAEFDRWSQRLVQTLGQDNVTQTVEHLHEVKRVLDADAKHFESGKEQT
jgi:DNA-binding MarR family transcriptional regulator